MQGNSTNSEYVYFDRGTGLWYDGSSDMSCYMVVELDNYKIYKDTDSDGLPDYMETQGMRASNGRTYYTDMRNADTDGDGLSDAEEMGTPRVFSESNNGIRVVKATVNLINKPRNLMFMMNSSPNDVDSDGDGFTDSHDLHPWTQAENFELYSQVYDPELDDSFDFVEGFFEEAEARSNKSYDKKTPTRSDEILFAYLRLLENISYFNLPEASDALDHYLDNTGDYYDLDVSHLITEDTLSCFTNSYLAMSKLPILRRNFDSPVGDYYYFLYYFEMVELAKSVLIDGDSITIMVTDGRTSYNANMLTLGINIDWTMVLGVGGSSCAYEATISRDRLIYTVTYRYCVYDFYDWNINAPFIPLILPSDSSIHQLHECGLAREYPIYGEITNQYWFV